MPQVEIHRNYDLNTPSWEDILNNFNQSALNKEKILNISPGFFTSHSAHKIKEVENVLKKLNLTTAHLYFNVVELSETFHKHKDDCDVYFWQVKGKSKWIIEDNTEYILNESDLIIIPEGTYHKVYSLGVRAGISMSI